MTKLYRKTSAASAKPVAKVAKDDRVSIYDEVTASIIAQLESGVAPWAKPWVSTGGSLGMPLNGKSGRQYSGINVLLLWNAMQKNAYSSPYFFTFKQALDLGGRVRKGEKATKIVYADRYIPKGEREAATREGREAASVPFLRGFYVFNAEQIDELPARFTAEPEPVSEIVKHKGAERLFAASGAKVRLGGSRAFFSPSGDYIGMPLPTSFRDPLDFYRTGLHELTHWTGHESRLARTFGKRFADSAYAREELVAELGAAFLCASVGIQPTVNHASYLDHWIKVLREDCRAIFQAASLASKAADYLFGFLPDNGPGDHDGTDDGEDDANERVAAPVEPVAPSPAPEPVASLPEPVAAPVEPIGAPDGDLFGPCPVAAPVELSEPVPFEPCRYDGEAVAAYYEGGRRVMLGGAPCKVFSRPMSAETSALKARLAYVMAGEAEWTPDPAFPSFTFQPCDKPERRKAKSPAKLAVKACREVRAYYAGGHRITVGGVPCRIARKPATKNHSRLLQSSNPFTPYETPGKLPMRETDAERAARVAWERRLGFADRMTALPERKRKAA